jgi:hypothetical protein
MGNPFNQFNEGWDASQGRFDQLAQRQAGNMLASGDTSGAANALFRAGDIKTGVGLQESQRKRQSEETAEKLKWMSSAADALTRVPADGRQQAFDQHLLPTFQAMGLPPDVIDTLRRADKSDQALALFKRDVDNQYDFFTTRGGGVYKGNKRTGSVEAFRDPTPESPKGSWKERTNADGSTSLVWLTDPGAEAAPAPAAPAAADAPVATARPNTDAVWSAMKQRESGGRPGVIGPQTPYGRAQGLTQMLPATAREMAQKLGVPWRPELMTGKTPEAAAYQEQLGRAYYEEGLAKYGGDPAKAAAYYHGGPNERLWGPKTQEYARAVTGGQGQNPPMAGGDGGDTLRSGREIAWSAPGAAKGKGRPATAEEKARFGIPENVPAQIKPDGTVDVIQLPKGTEDPAKAEQSKQMRAEKARNIIATVDGALGLIGKGVLPGSGEAGFRGAVASRIPGTKAYDLARTMETIKANLGFEELQAMRDASPTGGALGQVAVQELVALQATVANLDIGQSETQLRGNLNRIKSHYSKWKNAVERAETGAGQVGAGKRLSPQEAAKLAPGTKFIGMDGVERTRK